MSIQLTPEQEQRILATVHAGASNSAEESLDAACSADFEGSPAELESLLFEGLNSGAPIEVDDAFWNRLTAKTDEIATAYAKLKQTTRL